MSQYDVEIALIALEKQVIQQIEELNVNANETPSYPEMKKYQDMLAEIIDNK